jgi:hypothetical protein
MADVNANIEITASDKASGEIEGVGKKSNKALKAVKKFGQAGAKAFKGFAIAAVGINQALEVMKKFKEVATAAIEKSLAFRSANDPLVKSFQQISDSVGALAARMGDVLLNVFVAVGNQFAPLIERSRDFLEANQQILAIGLVEFFQKMAIAITQGVAGAFNLARDIATKFEQGMIAVTAAFLSFASMFSDEYAPALREAEKEFHKLGKEQEDFEARTNKIATAVEEGIGQVSVGAIKALGTATAGLNKPYEKLVATQEKQKAHLQTIAGLEERIQGQLDEAAATNLQRRIDLTNSLMAAQEEQAAKAAEKLQEEVDAAVTGADSISSAFVSAYGAAEEGQNRFGVAMRAAGASAIDIALESMQKQVMASAAVGAGNAAASFGWAGPVVASAAAAAMFGLIRGFIAMGMEGMAEGGLVRGGVSGKDSVPKMLMPGEFVLTKEQTDSLRAGGGGGLGSQTVNIELNSTMPQSRAEIKRFVRQNVVPALRDLKAQGMF